MAYINPQNTCRGGKQNYDGWWVPDFINPRRGRTPRFHQKLRVSRFKIMLHLLLYLNNTPGTSYCGGRRGKALRGINSSEGVCPDFVNLMRGGGNPDFSKN